MDKMDLESILGVIETSAEERVDNGARWLDENFPGWVERIDVDTLDLTSGNACICGQVFESEAATTDLINICDGYGFANRTLFTEANSWITGLVGVDVIGHREESGLRSDRATLALRSDRVTLVSLALGFNCCLSFGTTSQIADSAIENAAALNPIGFTELQNAWVQALAERTTAD